MSKKKHKLKVDPFSDIEIVGISSSEDDLRLCWLINENLGYNFQLEEPLLNISAKKNTQFIRYSAEDDSGLYKMYLIRNLSAGDFLIPELKTIDFLIFIQGEPPNIFIDELTEGLRSVSKITAVLNIPKSGLRSLKKITLD